MESRTPRDVPKPDYGGRSRIYQFQLGIPGVFRPDSRYPTSVPSVYLLESHSVLNGSFDGCYLTRKKFSTQKTRVSKPSFWTSVTPIVCR